MHHIYNTEAIVLDSASRGEADKAVWLLTRELGLVVARAQSAREERSKMRYGLQEFSIIDASLVHGKSGWRMTGVVLTEQLYPHLRKAETLATAVRVRYLLKRLVPQEEADEHVYMAARSGLAAFAFKNVDESIVELLLVARVLAALGYMPERAEYTELIADNAYKLTLTSKLRKQLLEDINNAIVNADL